MFHSLARAYSKRKEQQRVKPARTQEHGGKETTSITRCIADSLQISKDTVHRILRDELLFRKVCSACVSHMLTAKHKAERVVCAQSILQLFNNYCEHKLLRLLAVQDESCITFDSVLSKSENMAWLAPQDRRPTVVREQMTFR